MRKNSICDPSDHATNRSAGAHSDGLQDDQQAASPDQLPVDLVDHLCRHSALTAAEARRLLVEVLAFYAENTDEFIRRRHLELQAAGLANPAIFTTIQLELHQRRFSTAAISVRQIRRVIYG